MGHHTVDVSALAVHKTLRLHPNFKFPDVPAGVRLDGPDITAAVVFAIESVAAYVSPPKAEGEDDELECIDVATAIREYLRPEIMRKLGLASAPPLNER